MICKPKKYHELRRVSIATVLEQCGFFTILSAKNNAVRIHPIAPMSCQGVTFLKFRVIFLGF